MDFDAFKSLSRSSGLELSEDRARELFEYSRRLFAHLKPGRGWSAGEDEATTEQVNRIFGRTRSILELDLDETPPAHIFSIPRVRD